MLLEDIKEVLQEKCGSMCLDDDYELEQIALAVQELLTSQYGEREPTDDATEVHALIRFDPPEFANLYNMANKPKDALRDVIMRAYPLLNGQEFAVTILPSRPFRKVF